MTDQSRLGFEVCCIEINKISFAEKRISKRGHYRGRLNRYTIGNRQTHRLGASSNVTLLPSADLRLGIDC